VSFAVSDGLGEHALGT